MQRRTEIPSPAAADGRRRAGVVAALALAVTMGISVQHDARAQARAAVETVAQATGAAPAGAPAGAPAQADRSPIRVLLIPMQETTVVSQIVGQINRLGGDIGASFAKGATLVAFDCGELQAKLKMSEAELTSASEQHESKIRLQGLNAAGEVEVAMAAAAVEKARAQIDLSRAQLRQCVIPAPFAGRIVKLHVRQYQGVNVGQPLMDVVSGGPLKVKLNAPSKWLTWLRPGARFEVAIDETGRTYPATVSAVNGRVDAVSQSVEIEGRVNGAFVELLAGMSGNARFPQAQ
jgi:RND family efflux transporter MFP subunit